MCPSPPHGWEARRVLIVVFLSVAVNSPQQRAFPNCENGGSLISLSPQDWGKRTQCRPRGHHVFRL
jgi:hypothetical protein